MAAATLNELTTRVLQKLKVLQAGETVEAEDSTFIQSAIAAVNEKLRDLEVCYWEDNATPRAVFEDLAMYIACHCAGDYMEEQEAQAFRNMNEMRSEAQIRRLTSSRERVDKPTKAEFF